MSDWFWYDPAHHKTNKMTCASSEDSDQPGYPPSLIRVFAVRLKKHWVDSYMYPLSAQRRLIWVFAGRTSFLSVLSCCSSFIKERNFYSRLGVYIILPRGPVSQKVHKRYHSCICVHCIYYTSTPFLENIFFFFFFFLIGFHLKIWCRCSIHFDIMLMMLNKLYLEKLKDPQLYYVFNYLFIESVGAGALVYCSIAVLHRL